MVADRATACQHGFINHFTISATRSPRRRHTVIPPKEKKANEMGFRDLFGMKDGSAADESTVSVPDALAMLAAGRLS